MKLVVILSLLGLLGLFLYVRLRPYIRAARQVLGVLRDARRMSEGRMPVGQTRQQPRGARPAATSERAEKLVRCASCGMWLPASRAVALRTSNAAYCSHVCLERAADSSTRPRKWAP